MRLSGGAGGSGGRLLVGGLRLGLLRLLLLAFVLVLLESLVERRAVALREREQRLDGLHPVLVAGAFVHAGAVESPDLLLHRRRRVALGRLEDPLEILLVALVDLAEAAHPARLVAGDRRALHPAAAGRTRRSPCRGRRRGSSPPHPDRRRRGSHPRRRAPGSRGWGGDGQARRRRAEGGRRRGGRWPRLRASWMVCRRWGCPGLTHRR